MAKKDIKKSDDEIKDEDIEILEETEENIEDIPKKIEEIKTKPIFDKFALESLDLEKMKGIGDKATQIYSDFRANKINDIPAIITAGEEKIVEMGINGLGKARVKALLELCTKQMGRISAEYSTNIKMIPDIWSTGTKCFDQILGGGIRTGTNMVLYGKGETGKSITCSTIACRLFLPYVPIPITDPATGKQAIDSVFGDKLVINVGGLVKENQSLPEVLWFDTEDTYCKMLMAKANIDDDKYIELLKNPKAEKMAKEATITIVASRFEQICKSIGLDFNKDVRPHIIVCAASTVKDMIMDAEKMAKTAHHHNIRLIVVDSLSKLFKAERGKKNFEEGKSMLNETSMDAQKMNYFFALLESIAQKSSGKAAIIYTNQVYTDFDPYKAKFDHNTGKLTDIQYGGSAVKFNIDNHLHLVKGSRGIYEAILTASSYLEPRDGAYIISSAGIEDADPSSLKKPTE